MNKRTLQMVVPGYIFLAIFSFVLLLQIKKDSLPDMSLSNISESCIISLWFVGNFYLFFSFIIPHYLEKGNIKMFIILSLFFLILSPVIIDLILKLNRFVFSTHIYYPLTLRGFAGGVFGSFVSGCFGASARIAVNWFDFKQKEKELINTNIQSELKLLKSKLNPHFLFNTINNIDTLIINSPEKASDLLSKLSDLLRYVIYETENDKSKLTDEIKTIEKYIELQKIRIFYPQNIQVNIKTPLSDILIPPMLFLPFIENAFKHSNLNKPDHHIFIELELTDNRLTFICRNTFSPAESTEGVGLGLAKRRLELYFPGSFNLEIKPDGNTYNISLIINLNEN